MATKRQKKTVITGVSRDAAEEAFASYAKADAQIEKINAEIDLQCAKIREKYQQKLGELTCERTGDTAEVELSMVMPYSDAVTDAEFVRQADQFLAGLDSFDALRERMREGLQAYLDRQAADDLKARLLDRLLEDFEIPQDRLDRAIDRQLQTLEAQLSRQGLTLDAYCQFMGKTREQLREDCAPDARKGIQRQRIDEIFQIVRYHGSCAAQAKDEQRDHLYHKQHQRNAAH